MIQTRPFSYCDVLKIDLQPWQVQPEFQLNEQYGEWLQENSYCAYTILDGEMVIGAGGAIEIWNGRAEVWLLLDRKSGSVMNGVHRVVTRFLNALPHWRVETGCEVQWPEAHRWLKMLGFEHERTARKYMPSGRDIDIYVRIR